MTKTKLIVQCFFQIISNDLTSERKPLILFLLYSFIIESYDSYVINWCSEINNEKTNEMLFSEYLFAEIKPKVFCVLIQHKNSFKVFISHCVENMKSYFKIMKQ